MTAPKASVVLAICIVFDILRGFFAYFWFFGPALTAMYCSSTVNGALGTSVTSGIVGKGVAVGCSFAAGTAAGAIMPGLVVFGTVMAMVVGFAGWLIVLGGLVLFNARIFKANASSAIMMLAGLGVSELPVINVLPALTGTIGKMFYTQIKKEKAALKDWKKDQELLARKQREQQIAQFMMAQQQGEIEEAEYREAEEQEAIAQEAEEIHQ